MAAKREITEPQIELTKKGASSISEEVNEMLRKKQLSPSLVTGLEGCPARWFTDTFVMRDLIPEPKDNPALRGSLFHKVMEDLFNLPQGERTPDNLIRIMNEVMESSDFRELTLDPEVVEWLKNAVQGYIDMGGRPDKVKIAEIEKDGKILHGVEFFVKGVIGNCSRKTVGFIDRLVENPKNPGTYIIEDWKTAVEAKHYNPNDKYKKGFAEQRQQATYSILLEADGIEISGARLIYPIPRDRVQVNLKDKKLMEEVVESFEEADRKLTEYTEANLFPYVPGALCAWCSLAKACPRSKIIPQQKFQDAFYSQPGIEILSVGIKF